MSAAFPDVNPQYASVSPLLSEAVYENLECFTRLNKTLTELTQKVVVIHSEAANSILSTVDTFNKKINDVSKTKYFQNDSYVKFMQRILEQMEIQAKIVMTLGTSFSECVINPLQEAVIKKREVWKTCSHYVQTFQDQIRNKEDDLVKRQKDYFDAAAKVKSSAQPKPKQKLILNNCHNTYLLRLSSVNSINNLLYTHVLPHVFHSLEENQSELNDSLRHHVKYMFSVQKDTLKKLIKSVDKADHAAEKLDIVSDLKKFIKITMKSGLKDKSPPRYEFSYSDQSQRRGSVLVEPKHDLFIVNKFTQPNLQRRLAALQFQTNQLVDSISSMRAGGSQELQQYLKSEDPALNDIIELLCICDKEANLNVLLKQMELYTPEVLNFLGPTPENIMLESKHTKMSPSHQLQASNGQVPHEFIEPKLIKPVSCYYCDKMILLMGKGFVCKVCKMPVHKKCVTNVPFCDRQLVKLKSRTKSTTSANTPSLYEVKPESSVVCDLIDLESDGDYYDDDEFDDGFSDEDDFELPTQSSSLPNEGKKPSVAVKPILTPVKPHKPQLTKINKPLPREPGEKTRRHTMPVFSVAPQLPGRPAYNEAESVAKPKIAVKPTVSKKPSMSSSLAKQTQGYCVALYDFSVTDSTHLALIAGCRVELLEKNSDDWWKGRNNGMSGFFPSQYALEIKKNDVVMKSNFDFMPENEQEVPLEEGQIVVFVSEEDDWCKVRSIAGEGLVPASYVQRI